MVNDILTGAGFVKNKTYRETRFLKPPKVTFAVFNDSADIRGGDYENLIAEHETSIELYEYEPDTDAEQRIEAQFDALGQAYTKQERYWIEDEQLYQVIYDFSYIEKRSV